MLRFNPFVFPTPSTNQTNAITKEEFSAQRGNKSSRKPVLALQRAVVSHRGAVTRVTGGTKTNPTLFLHPRLDGFAEAIGPKVPERGLNMIHLPHTHTLLYLGGVFIMKRHILTSQVRYFISLYQSQSISK